MTTLSSKRPSKAATTHARILRDVQDTTVPMSRLNVQVPKTLLRDIKLIAVRRDETVSDIVRTHLIEYRSKYSDE